MTEDNQLSRRQSLLGIGAAGATLTGMAGCLGDDETATETERTSGDGDDDDENGGETAKKGHLALEVVCHEPGEAMLRVRNEATDEVEVDWTVTIDDVDLEALAALVHRFEDIDELDDYDDLDDYHDELDDYDVDQDDYDRLEEFLDEIGLDHVDVEDLEGKEITLEGTTLTIGKTEIDLRTVAEKKGIDLDDAPIDLEKLSGTLTIPKGADETFWAGVFTEGTNVDLYYDGKKVDSVDIDAADCERGDEEKKKQKKSGEDDHDHDHDSDHDHDH